ncbi:MAG: hypothetical protein IT256_07765 [Chitinophagaceae bacterium]|nr:hypothetical protein [Chitinophagaceae bacterium]
MHLIGFFTDWKNTTFQILRVVDYAFMFVLIFLYLSRDGSQLLNVVSLLLSLLFKFGSAGSVLNIIVGLVLTCTRLFKIKYSVIIGGVLSGVIEEFSIVSKVINIRNETILIRNSIIMSSHIA